MRRSLYFQKCQELIDYMEDLNYSPVTIINFQKMIKRIDSHVTWHHPSQYRAFEKTLKWHCNKQNFNVIIRYVLFGRKPIPFERERKWEQKVSTISGEMKELIEQYIEVATKQQYKHSTIKLRRLCLTKFFFFVQSRGKYKLSDISEDDVFEFYLNKTLSPITCKHFRAALSCIESSNPIEVSRIINLLPQFPTTIKPKQVLSQQEMQKIHAVLTEENTRLSKRDRAIGLLAFYTGMRSGDIAKMKLDAIHWHKQQIILRQSKTGKWVVLALRPIVGNAIYEYLRDERPKGTHLDEVFLSETFLHTTINTGHVNNVGEKIYRLANVHQGKARKGLHIFRHTLVNQLLDLEVDSSIISSILGHQSPRSIENYLASNENYLSRFALDISDYPINYK